MGTQRSRLRATSLADSRPPNATSLDGLDDVAAQLAHGDRERRVGAERRLLEQQRHVLAIQDVRMRPALHALGLEHRRQRQGLFEGVGTQVED